MRSLRHTSTVILLATGFLLGAQAIVTWLLVERTRAEALQESGRTVMSLLAGAQSNVNRAFLQIDALLSGLESLASLPRAEGDPIPSGLNRSLRTLADQSFVIRDLALLGADGQVVAAGLAATLRHPPALPERFKAGAGGGLLISDPVRNVLTGDWSLYLGRMLSWRGGQPILAVAELPLATLTRVTVAELSMPGLRISLERGDGLQLMSVPHDALRIGRAVGGIADRLPVDGQWGVIESRLEARRKRVAAAAPTLYDDLVLVVGMDEDEALARWSETRNAFLAISGSAALFVLVLAAAGTLHVRSRDRDSREIERSKRMLDRALEAMGEGFALFDSDLRLVVANRRYAEMFPHLAGLLAPGTPAAAIAARAAEALLPGGSEEARRAWADRLMGVSGAQDSFEQELPSGMTVLTTQARTPDGGLVSVHRDVTVAKQVAATLAQAKEAAERASTAKTAFLAHMSHELRTPLNAIIGFSDLIRTRIVGPEIHDTYVEYAQDIHDSGRHLLSLINDVLDVARIETGAAKLDETLVSTRATAYAAVRFIQVLAEEKGVRLVIDDGKLEERALRCDARGLRQCLINLLSNAVKFTDAGGQIEVSGRVLTDGGYALAVRDTGSGIPADRLPSLFQPFANADPSLARGSLGAGLGLSITQGIVRMHGGRLDVRSQVGEGTTVTVILPAGRVLEPVDLAESRIARFASK